MFTGGTIWLLTHGHSDFSGVECQPSGSLRTVSSHRQGLWQLEQGPVEFLSPVTGKKGALLAASWSKGALEVWVSKV